MKAIYDLGNKNKAIVLFKFMAALLITYSHMAILFPRYGGLVTGGAIGDGMFFFCSGFTLFLGRDGGFFNWFKRRLGRIYPSIIVWALLSSVCFAWAWDVTDLVTTPKYWFIPCIVVYYAIIYFIKRYLFARLKQVFGVSALLVTIASFFVLDMDHSMMYAQISFMRIYFFLFMLMGAIVATDLRKEEASERIFGWLDKVVGGGKLIDNEQCTINNTPLSFGRCLAGVGVSLVLYYGCMAMFKLGPVYCKFQMVSLIPLLTMVYYLFKLCSTRRVESLLDNAWIGNVIYVISSLTLEIYLVQYSIFTDALNGIFPLNIVIVYLLIFAAAYVLKCVSSLFSMVFDAKDADWRGMFKIN